MDLENDSVIGIVGGMGPQSGIALFNSILSYTQAIKDQDHLSVILMSLPRYIEDRTAFLEGEVTVNPAFSIIKIIEKLVIAGAKVICIACNTSHSPLIFNPIVEEVEKWDNKVVLLNLPFEVCKYLNHLGPQSKRIGLMTTNGSYKTKVYENLLRSQGYEVVVPDFTFQNEVIHKLIYDPDIGIKANPKGIRPEAKKLFKKAMIFFRARETDVVVLGCTELSLALEDCKSEGVRIVDSMEVLSKAVIREALIITRKSNQEPVLT